MLRQNGKTDSVAKRILEICDNFVSYPIECDKLEDFCRFVNSLQSTNTKSINVLVITDNLIRNNNLLAKCFGEVSDLIDQRFSNFSHDEKMFCLFPNYHYSENGFQVKQLKGIDISDVSTSPKFQAKRISLNFAFRSVTSNTRAEDLIFTRGIRYDEILFDVDLKNLVSLDSDVIDLLIESCANVKNRKEK